MKLLSISLLENLKVINMYIIYLPRRLTILTIPLGRRYYNMLKVYESLVGETFALDTPMGSKAVTLSFGSKSNRSSRSEISFLPEA